ncbi:MAG: DNA gyrase inhibitor YacG [Terracidiphilus sp.]
MEADAMAAKKKSTKLFKCPICGTIIQPKDEDFPFCSDRCRKIDLGKWATGVYKISSPVLDPEVLEDLGEFGNSRGGSHDE